tara:strand:- start:539 stop:853 length:315 start_codon:yes stop_codon:yes gene_type:complete
MNIPDDFKWDEYLELNKDLGNAGIRTKYDAIIHWIEYGMNENRRYNISETFLFPKNKKAAYISSWDDSSNIDSFLHIIQICKEINLELPLTLFLNTSELDNINI